MWGSLSELRVQYDSLLDVLEQTYGYLELLIPSVYSYFLQYSTLNFSLRGYKVKVLELIILSLEVQGTVHRC